MGIKKIIIVILFMIIIVSIPNSSKNIDVKIKKIDLEITEEFRKIVTLTTYTIDPLQTDSTPLITASGFKLDSINPRRHRVIAVSRDLKRKLKFGDKVRLSNAGRFNGVWYVRDLMNKRFKNKIDVLINPNGRHTKLSGVIITKID
jgi:3D (Asp-Asp-Asp) domain-containing protein